MFPRRGSARLIPLLLASLFMAEPAAARVAEVLRLGARIPAVCVLRISDVVETVTVGNGDQPIATVAEKCNDRDGYRIVLLSRNGGALIGGGRRIDYTVSYGNLQDEQLAEPRSLDRTRPQMDWHSRTLAVSIPPLPPMQGSVSDALIVSIEAR